MPLRPLSPRWAVLVAMACVSCVAKEIPPAADEAEPAVEAAPETAPPVVEPPAPTVSNGELPPPPPPLDPVPVVPVEPVGPQLPEPGATDARSDVGTLRVLVQQSLDRRHGDIPLNLCRGADELWWTTSRSELWSKALPAGVPRQRVPAGGPLFVACDGAGPVWDSDDGLHALGPDGEVVSIVAGIEGSTFPAAVDETHAYYKIFRDPGVYRVPRTGGPGETVARSKRPGPVALDETHLYFTDYSAGTVTRVAKSGGRAEVLAKNQRRPIAIAVDETHVYWGNERGGSVHRAAKTGGRGSKLLTGEVNHDRFQVHDGWLYWYSWGTDKDGHSFARMPIEGGDLQRLIVHLSSPSDFQVFEGGAFVVSKLEGAILELTFDTSAPAVAD